MGDLSQGDVVHAPFDAALVDACGPGQLTPAGSSVLSRRPYLQKTTAHSTAILWTADTDAALAVEVREPDGTRVATVPASVDPTAPLPAGDQFVADVAGLSPGSTYCYTLTADGAPLTGPIGFRTAPAPGTEAPIRFASFGDSGSGYSDQFAVLDQLVDVPLDFVVVNGDVAYDAGTLDQFEHNFFDVYADVADQVPFFPASGNHEYKTDDAAPFREVFDLFENGGPGGRERWYSFDWGNAHVVVLDTEQVGTEQATWLDHDLATTTRPWKIVVAHRPPYSSGTHGGDDAVRRMFVPLFEEHDVALVLLGHEHDYERTVPLGGVTYIVSGGGGKGTRPIGSSAFTAFAAQVAHFTYVTIDGDVLRAYAIDGTGKVFDTVAIERP
jgi:hypothetical protein